MKNDDVMRVMVEDEDGGGGDRKASYASLPFITLDHYEEANVVCVIVVDADPTESVAMLTGRKKSLRDAEELLKMLDSLVVVVREQRDKLLQAAS
jgi:hypothetical protein